MIEDIRKIRLDKLEQIQNSGIDPYPAKTKRSHLIEETIANFNELEKSKTEIIIAGRIRSWRSHGGSTFANIEDTTGVMQVYFKKDALGEKQYDFLNIFDVGDFIETKGTLFVTKKGEKTLLVSEYTILSKSLLPLPDKWHGLEDQEKRFRKRYLDLIMNREVKNRFIKRAKIIKEIRHILEKEGFMEVETPILQELAGGAAAKPFITHLNALDIDLYLRIAPELYLKRLIVGGFEKVYEIGRCFRNEGIDRQHNPDFTMLEFYWAYTDYNFLMEFTEKMLSETVKKVCGDHKIKYQGNELDFKPPWPRISFVGSVKDKCGIDIIKEGTEENLRAAMEKLGIKTAGIIGFGKLADELYKETVRKNIIGPAFIVDHPIQLGPLAKAHPDTKTVQRFQVLISGFEIVNTYSELNDPIDQRKRLEYQMELRKKGDDEAPDLVDEDYIEAMEYGMPPIAGEGIGIDRLAAILTDAPSLREIILFPTMRPERSALNSKIQRPNDKQNPNAKCQNNNPQTNNITRTEALELIKKKVKNENTIKHMLATEAVMKALAAKFGENEELWAMAGLLHDGDMENPEAMADHSKHGAIIADELAKRGVADIVASAIRAHNEKTGESRDTLIKKAIYSADPLTGFIVACVLVRPDKKIANLEIGSVMKKFKDKAFAKGASREIIKSCAEFDMELKEFIEIGLNAMKKIDKDLEL